MKKILTTLVLLVSLGALGVWATFLLTGEIPFTEIRKTPWAIGVLAGPTPFDLRPIQGVTNPVLTGSDIHDFSADFVADPFQIRTEAGFFLFFEVWNDARGLGEVAVARSPDGRRWEYDKVVMTQPYHLSYPSVFRHQGQFYMITDSYQDDDVKLFRASRFPYDWEQVATLLEGEPFVDPTVFEDGGRWWMFSSEVTNRTLRLHSAPDLLGPWSEHPASPLIRDNGHISRPAGRVTRYQGSLYRFTQDCDPNYGLSVSAFRITTLTPEAYGEEATPGNPVIQRGVYPWGALGMHHLDPLQLEDGTWQAVVDGTGLERVLRLW